MSSEWLRWRTSSGEPLPPFPAIPGENAVGLFYESTTDAGVILFATQRMLRLWHPDPRPSRAVVLESEPSLPVWAVAWSPDGARFASGDGGFAVRIRDSKTHALLRSFTGHTETVGAVAFAPDGKTLASGSFEASNNLKHWDVATGRLLKLFHGEPGECRALAFSSGGDTLASASERGPIQIWDARTGLAVLTLEGYRTYSNSLAFSPVDPIFISGRHDGSIRLWDARP